MTKEVSIEGTGQRLDKMGEDDRLTALREIHAKIENAHQVVGEIKSLINDACDRLRSDLTVSLALDAIKAREQHEAERTTYLSISDLQTRLRLSRQTIYRLRREGAFPPHFMLGRRAMWRTGDISDWIDGTQTSR